MLLFPYTPGSLLSFFLYNFTCIKHTLPNSPSFWILIKVIQSCYECTFMFYLAHTKTYQVSPSSRLPYANKKYPSSQLRFLCQPVRWRVIFIRAEALKFLACLWCFSVIFPNKLFILDCKAQEVGEIRNSGVRLQAQEKRYLLKAEKFLTNVKVYNHFRQEM